MERANAVSASAHVVVEHETRVSALWGSPRIPRFVLRRPALVEALEAALDAQLVLLRGPAGVGKSALLADWAETGSARPGSGALVRVDASDGSDREVFWTTALRALRNASPALPEWHGVGPDADDPRRAAEVREAFLSCVGDSRFLIFDNFDNVQFAEVVEDIVWLLHCRPRLTVVISSRTRTRFETANVLASVDAHILDTGQLVFTRAESDAVLTLRGASFEEKVGLRVYEQFMGNPAAVNLTAAHLALDKRRLWREHSIEAVMDSVQHELNEALLGDLRHLDLWPYLRHTGLLPFLTVDLVAQFVDSVEQIEPLLRVIEDVGLGQWTRTHGQNRFVFSALARKSLMTELASDSPIVIRAIRQRIAGVLTDIGEPGEAMLQSALAEDWELFAIVTRRFHAELLGHNLSGLVRSFKFVPPGVVAKSPWLSLLQGLLAFARDAADISSSAAAFARAESLSRELTADSQLGATERIVLTGIRNVSLRRSGSLGRAVALADKLPSYVDALSSHDRVTAAGEVSETLLQSGITYLHAGMYAQAIRSFTDAYRSDGASAHGRVQCAGYISLIRALRGEVIIAEEWWNRATQDRHWHQWHHTVWAVPVYLAGALLAVERFGIPAATRDLNIVDRLGVDVEDWPLVAYVSGMVNLIAGNGYASFGAIRDIEGRLAKTPISNHFQSMLAVVKSDLLLSAKQARAALETLRPYVDGRESTVSANARALLFSGNEARALVYAERWGWKDELSPRKRMEIQLVRAIASLRLGDTAGASGGLRKALSLGEMSGLQLPLGMVPLDELLAVFAKAGVDPSTVLVSARGVFSGGLTVPTLTRRESLVLHRLQSSALLEAIARELVVSPNTVKTQVRSIYRKLGVSSRAEAVRVALEWRLIAPIANPSEQNVKRLTA